MTKEGLDYIKEFSSKKWIYKIKCSFLDYERFIYLEVNDLNETRKLQQLYKCKNCGYFHIRSRYLLPKTFKMSAL